MSDKKVQGFPTTDGRIISVRPVDMKFGVTLLRNSIKGRYERAGEPITPPTYTITTASGAKETHPHDETTLQTEEDKAAWAAHASAKARMDREFSEGFMRYLLLGGVICAAIPKEWVEQCTFLGLDLPENAGERKLLYIQMELLPTPADLERAMAAIMAVSGSGSQEMIRTAEDLFRRAMAGPSAQLDTSAGGRVELQPSVSGDQGNASVGEPAPVTV
jgi:hypothetical protein